ncbi:MAG: DUF2510 domain-containing protein [Actinomycetia bacterium]|nr:DUF2510 domain-containing protein [Actinomycetes bacterium]
MADDEDVPSGWYPDPADPGLERFWTGSEWFGSPRKAIIPRLPSEPPPPRLQSLPSSSPPPPTGAPSPSGPPPPTGPPSSVGSPPSYSSAAPPIWPRKSRAGLALGLSIAGFFCCGILSVAGMILGKQDMNAIDRGETDPSQRGMAQGAFIVGLIITALLVVGLVLYVVRTASIIESNQVG